MYKKYIKRDGKIFGPYYYSSKRIHGKVVSQYVHEPKSFGKSENSVKEKKHHSGLFFAFLFLPLILASFFIALQYLPANLTGNAVLQLSPSYSLGEKISGSMHFSLQAGELLPENTNVEVSLGSQKKSLPLSEILTGNNASGNFYIKGKEISGSGNGYGVEGVKGGEIEFSLLVRQEEVSSNSDSEGENAGENISTNENSNNEENDAGEGGAAGLPDETPTEVPIEVPSEETNTEAETSSENIEAPSENTETPSDSGDNSGASESGDSEASDSGNSEGGTGEGGGAGEAGGGDTSSQGESSGITGSAIIENIENEKIISGSVSKDKPFSYNLEAGESAEIIEGSVEINGESADSSVLSIRNGDGEVIVETEYASDSGFGADYLGEDKINYNISLDVFNLSAEDGSLDIRLSYDNVNLVEESSLISVNGEENFINETEGNQSGQAEGIAENQSITNQSINQSVNETETAENLTLSLIKPIVNIKVKNNGNYSLNLSDYFANAERYSYSVGENISIEIDGDEAVIIPDKDFIGSSNATIIAERENESVESPFSVDVSENVIDISTKQLNRVRLGEPVKWRTSINLEQPQNVTVEIPKDADKIEISKIEDGVKEDITDNSAGIAGVSNTGEVGLTGNAISNNEGGNGILTRMWRSISGGITGRAIQEEEANTDTKEVSINDTGTNYTIEYETPAPYAIEQNTGNGKEITIVGPDSVHYTDIVAYTELEKEVSQDKIRLYWISETGKEEVSADKFDKNGNGLVDYIEWNVSHLSNQTYQLIIEISRAEHLDSNRTFIEDVYEQVKAQDGNYSLIPSGNYLRVSFERNLTSINDITVYANSAGNNSKIEIYAEDSDEKIAELDNIAASEKYRVLLTSLGDKSYETFDLKSVGDISYDYVVDPDTTAPYGYLIAPANNSNGNAWNNSISIRFEFNATDETALLNATLYFWNSTGGLLGTNFSTLTGTNDGKNLTYLFPIAGKYWWNVLFYDAAGNSNWTVLGNYTFNVSDVIVPTVSLLTPANNSVWTSNSLVSFIFNASDTSNLKFCNLTVSSTTLYNQSANAINTNGLVGMWKMDSNWNDALGLNNGTAYEATFNTTSYRLGTASGQFNSSSGSSYVAFGTTINPTQITVSMWINPASLTQVQYNNPAGKEEVGYKGWTFQSPNTATGYYFEIGQGSAWKDSATTSALPANTWTHLVGVSDGTNLQIYVNGVQSGSNTTGGNIASSSHQLAIGHDSYDGSRGFNGSFDDVAVYNRSLSPAEITAIYNAQVSNYYYNSSASINNGINTTITYNFSNGNYTYNINCTDNSTSLNTALSDTYNFSVSYTYVAPYLNISLNSPANNSVWSSSSTVSFNYNVTNSSAISFCNLTASTTTAASEINPSTQTGLVALYHLNNNSNDATGRYNGTNLGDTFVSYGKLGFALSDANGASKAINITGITDASTSHTIALWVNSSMTATTFGYLLDSESGRLVIAFNSNTAGKIGVYDNVAWRVLNDAPNDGTWHHLAFVLDAANTKVLYYQDGVNTVNGTYSGIGIGGTTVIGGTYSLTNDNLNGLIDELAIYNRTLSASEILTLYNSQIAGVTNYLNSSTSISQNNNILSLNLSNADYTWNINCTSADTTGLSETRNVSVSYTADTTAPYVAWISPVNGTTYATTPITVNITNNSDAAFIWWNNGTANLSYASFVTLTLANGQYSFVAYANDSSGNLNSTNVTFSVNAYPSISFIGQTPANNNVTNVTSAFINVSSSDVGITGIHSVVMDWNRSLVLWIRMDDRNASGDVWDRSSYSNNGTISGATYNSSGKYGGAMTLNGVSNTITVRSSASINSSSVLSFSVWVKPAISARQGIMNKYVTTGNNRAWRLAVSADNTTALTLSSDGINGNAYSSTGKLNIGQWNHIYIGWDNSSRRMLEYFNGVLAGNSSTTETSLFNSTANLVVGYEYGTSYPFNGSLDDLMLFDRLLSSQGILALYNATANQYYNNFTGLVGGSNYSYIAYAQDANGNLNNTETRYLNITSSAVLYSDINLTSPANNSEIARGGSGTSEDDAGVVSDLTVLKANVYDNSTFAGINNSNCSFYWNNTFVGSNLTNSSGDCIFSYDKSGLAAGNMSLLVNYSTISGYTRDINSSVINIRFVQLSIPNAVNNIRAGNQYMVGDAAVVSFNFTKDGVLFDPVKITVNATKSDTTPVINYVYSSASTSANIFKTATGQYYVVSVVNATFGSFIRWQIQAFDSSNNSIASAIEADKDVISATGSISVNLGQSVGGSVNATSQFEYSLYDRNDYLIDNSSNSMNYTRGIAAYDKYKLLSLGNENLSLNLWGLNVSGNISLNPQLVESISIPSVAHTSNALALNSSGFSFDNVTITLKTNGLSINQICKCENWSFANYNCSDNSWVCNSTSVYNVQSNSTNFWFNVSSFSGYAGGAGYNSNLSIWDSNDTEGGGSTIQAGQQARFYVNYTDSTSGVVITGATCNYSDNQTMDVNMTYNATSKMYEYNKSFASSATYAWNVSCYGNASYDNLTANDTVAIGSAGQILLTLITPPNLNNLNVTQGGFFNVSVNVSCISADCGDVNVSLDPETTVSLNSSYDLADQDPKGAGTNVASQMKWNIATIPISQTINDVRLCIETVVGGGPPNSITFNISYLNNQTWVENSVASNFEDQSSLLQNYTTSDLTSGLNGGYGCLNVTTQFQQAYANGNSNFTVRFWVVTYPPGTITTASYAGDPASTSVYVGNNDGEFISAHSYRYTTREDPDPDNKPYLNITYSSGKGLISTTTGATPFYTNESNPRTININASQSQIVTFYVNATGSIGANYTFFIYANRTADMGISNITSTWNVTIQSGADSTAPYFTGIPDNLSIYQNTSTGVGFNATDAVGFSCFSVDDTANFTINCSGWLSNKTYLAVGTYVLNITINDTTNNLNSTKYSVQMNATPDTTKPLVTIVNPLNGTNYNYSTTSILLNISVNENATCFWSNNSGASNTSMSTLNNQNFNYTIPVVSGNNYTLNIYCNDTANNMNNTESTIFSVNATPDSIPPYFTSIPDNSSLTSGQSLGVDFNATDETLFDNYYLGNWTSIFQINASGWLSNKSALSIGTYIINISINDSSGNTNFTWYQVQVNDTIAPYFTYIANVSIYTNSSVGIDFNATDETAFDCFSVNDTTNFAINCSGWLSNKTGLSAGIYNLNITINDTSNNLNSSIMLVNVTTVPDTTYPIFSDYWDNNATLVGSGLASFNVTIIETNGTVWLSINGTNYTATNLTANMYNISVTLTAGTHSYNWSAYGNGTSRLFNISNTRSYTVNATTPYLNISLNSPANNSVNTTSNLMRFDYNVTNSSAVSYCNLTANNGSTNFVNASSTIYQNNNNLSLNLSNGIYTWNISCSASDVNGTSETRTLNTSYTASSVVSLEACGNLTAQNTIYNLTTNLTSTGTCLLIWANNITVEGNNNNITYGTNTAANSYGILVTNNSNYSIIRNLRIYQGNSAGDRKFGIHLNNSKYSYINDNVILTSGNIAYGVYFSVGSNFNTLINNNISSITSGSSRWAHNIFLNGSNNNVTSNILNTSGGQGNSHGVNIFAGNNSVARNNVTVSSSNSVGVYLGYNNSYNNISSNTIISSGTSGYGLDAVSISLANIIENNLIKTSGKSGIGIYLWTNSSRNTISGNTIITSGTSGSGIYLDAGTKHNIILSNNISVNGSSSHALVIGAPGTGNNTLYNNIFNSVLGYGLYMPTSGNSSAGNWAYNNVFNGSTGAVSANVKSYSSLNRTKLAGTNIISGANLGGNFWTTKLGKIFPSNCVDLNNDSICDSPYTIYASSIDYLPLTSGDSAVPTVNITSPLNDTFVNGIVTIRVTAADNFAVKNISFYYMNTTRNWTYLGVDTTSPYTYAWNTASFSNGTVGYTISAIAFDTSNNNASDEKYYTIDRTKPYVDGMEIIYPTGQESAKNGQIVILKINVSDSPIVGAGINQTKVNLTDINGTGLIPMTFETGSFASNQWSEWNISASVLAASGLKSARIFVYDNATPTNNLRNSDAFAVRIDNIAPNFSKYGDTGTAYNHTEVGFYADVNDNFKLKSYIFSTNASGAWQNTSGDLSGTSGAVVLRETLYTGNWSYIFYIYDDAGNMNYTSTNNIEILGAEPVFTVYAEYPENGNYSTSNSVTFGYSYENGVATSCSLLINGEVNVTTNSPANHTIIESTINLIDGVYPWSVECVDSEDESVYSSGVQEIIVDTTAPDLVILSPQTVTYTSTAIDLNVTSEATDISAWWYSLNSGSNTTFTPNTTIIGAEGSNTIIVYVNDSLNHINYSSVSFTINTDTTLPVVNITYPLNTSYSVNVSALNYTITEANPSRCWYSNNSGVWNSSSVAARTNFTNVISIEGSNTWTVYCNDTAGNRNSTSVSFTIAAGVMGCTDGNTQSCTAANTCTGTQTCSGSSWGACSTSLSLCENGECEYYCGGHGCRSECNYGDINNICINDTSIGRETCGKDFDSDSCYEFGNLSILSTCNSDEICQNAVCVENIECTPSWRKGSVGLCNGTQTIEWNDANRCNSNNLSYIEVKSCNPSCFEDWQCDWTKCENETTSPYNCVDNNDCGTDNEKFTIQSCKWNCTPNLICGEWNSCSPHYTVNEVMTGLVDVKGIQERKCGDAADCISSIGDASIGNTRECELNAKVRLEKVIWCNDSYVEMYDIKTDKLVSRIKELDAMGKKQLNIDFLVSSFKGYCDYCYNEIQDYDEEGVDCGGSCPACTKTPEFKRNWLFLWWLLLLLLLALLTYLTWREWKKRHSIPDLKKLEEELNKAEKEVGIGSNIPALQEQEVEGDEDVEKNIKKEKGVRRKIVKKREKGRKVAKGEKKRV